MRLLGRGTLPSALGMARLAFECTPVSDYSSQEEQGQPCACISWVASVSGGEVCISET